MSAVRGEELRKSSKKFSKKRGKNYSDSDVGVVDRLLTSVARGEQRALSSKVLVDSARSERVEHLVEANEVFEMFGAVG